MAWAGGIIAPRARRCILVAGDDGASPNVAALLEVLARDLAAGGRCQLFDPGAAGPDSYRSLDLEDMEALGDHSTTAAGQAPAEG